MRNLLVFAAVSSTVVALAVAAPPRSPNGGHTLSERMAHGERWPVKVGADADVGNVVGLSSPLPTTVAKLTKEHYPAQLNLRADAANYRTSRANRVELTVYKLDVDIYEVKFEDDADYHVVVRDHGHPTGPTMIVEVPLPTFVPKASPWKNRIKQVRTKFSSKFHLTPGKKILLSTPVHASVVGVGFFDFIHATPQDGVCMNNAIELHPVVGVSFP